MRPFVDRIIAPFGKVVVIANNHGPIVITVLGVTSLVALIVFVPPLSAAWTLLILRIVTTPTPTPLPPPPTPTPLILPATPTPLVLPATPTPRIGPTRMPGVFNVAVSDFGELTAGQQVVTSEQGRLLSQWVFEDLNQELKRNAPPAFNVVVWHDSMPRSEKGSEIGTIFGSDPVQISQNAAKKADDLGADVIVYGNLDTSHSKATLVPAFRIRELVGDTGSLNDMLDGSFALGAPIPVDLPLDLQSKAFVNGELAARVDAAAWLTIGLTNDLNGKSQPALDAFQKALAAITNGEASPHGEPGDGKEIFFFFIGREDLALERLEEGTQAFRDALVSNPSYARAHIGLGSIYWTRARNISPPGRLQTPDLENAFAEYRLAVIGARAAHDQQAESQAHIALGSAFRLKGETYGFRGDYATADGLLDSAITEELTGRQLIESRQYRVLAYADSTLGDAYYQRANFRLLNGDKTTSRQWFEQAHDYYQQCIQQADNDPRDTYLTRTIKQGSCEKSDQAVTKALSDLTMTATPTKS
ncbi:MAG TPA: hypothetical protein VFZ25_09350 [Chloroflexota bacterium]|nr:hypothetical protein [Chloroflexota bacterium]